MCSEVELLSCKSAGSSFEKKKCSVDNINVDSYFASSYKNKKSDLPIESNLVMDVHIKL